MKVVFRADASVLIGSGHVMRCLALADALKSRGASCYFVCREQAGNLLEYIRGHGHTSLSLPKTVGETCDWLMDAEDTRRILVELIPNWLIVDHYRLGEEWEIALRSFAGRILAIDDIGRPHACDLLLDQNMPNPMHDSYRKMLAPKVELLLGPRYALVRPEFAALRPRALARRNGSLARVVVSMGGSDPYNETCKVLEGLGEGMGSKLDVDVVIGSSNPNRESVEAACARMSSAKLHVQTSKMGELMLAADCAICAGGSTTWERCCMGLSAIVTALSADQLAIAESLAKIGAHVYLGTNTELSSADYARALQGLDPDSLRAMSLAAAGVCDGHGVERIAERLH